MAVWNAVALEGATRLMVAGEGMATGWKGRYSTSMMDHFARGRLDGDRLSDTVKLTDCVLPDDLGRHHLFLHAWDPDSHRRRPHRLTLRLDDGRVTVGPPDDVVVSTARQRVGSRDGRPATSGEGPDSVREGSTHG